MLLKKVLVAGFATSMLAWGTASATNAAPKRVDVESMEGAAVIEYAAQPYIRFRQDVDYVTSSMPQNAAAMREAHLRLASHDTKAMSGSWIAYAAMVAADTPAFSAEIEKQMKKKGAKTFAAEIEANPGVVRNIPGSDEAVAAIMAFATNDAGKIRAAGDAFIADAYSMQKLAWARRAIAESGVNRVNAAMSYAAKRAWPTDTTRQVVRTRAGTLKPNLIGYETWSGNWAGKQMAVNPSAQPGTIVTKALVLGAHYTMNTATQGHLAAYGTSRKGERCFTSARMNLDQCIAATRTPYEEAFCLGQHALNDMAGCVGWPAGAADAAS